MYVAQKYYMAKFQDKVEKIFQNFRLYSNEFHILNQRFFNKKIMQQDKWHKPPTNHLIFVLNHQSMRK